MWLKDEPYVKRLIDLTSSGWNRDTIVRQVATEWRVQVASTNIEHSLAYIARLYDEAIRDGKLPPDEKD